MGLLDLAKRDSNELEAEFSAATADATRQQEALDVLAWLVGNGRAEQAEMLAWTWLSEFRGEHSQAEAADLARRLLLACPGSGQIRADAVDLIRSAAGNPDSAGWLAATGLADGKVSPQRALRAFDLAIAATPGTKLVERISTRNPDLLAHRIFEVISAVPAAGQVTIKPLNQPAGSRTLDVLTLGDEFMSVESDDFRVLARTDPARLKSLLADDPGAMLVAIIRAAGGQIDTDQLKDNLAERVLSAAEYGKWWSRARTAARKSPNVRIEGRNPAVLIYDHVGVTLEQETLATLSKTWEPPARVAVIEGYIKSKAADRLPPDDAFMAEVASRVARWMSMPSVSLEDALAARRLAELGVPVAAEYADEATRRLAEDPEVVNRVAAIDPAFWPMAVALLPAARPADWQEIYLQLLRHAPAESADAIAAALLDAGQADRLNAAILAMVESPVESMDGLAWLWVGPARAGELAIPPANELLDKLLWLAKQAETIAASDQPLARRIRATVRGALSARGYGRFREHVQSLAEDLAPLLRRQIRRADGLGLTVPETMLSILDEKFPPAAETKPASSRDVWLQEDRIYVSASAMAAKEKELEHITNVLMPANSRAIAAAAAHGDLSENSEYKFALEERDLLKVRAARVQQELAQARLLAASDVPTDHVSIYSRVELAPLSPADAEGGAIVVVEIVSPWDSDASRLRFNYKAPMSRQLLGKRVGDTVTLALDAGPQRQFRIARLAVAIADGPDKR